MRLFPIVSLVLFASINAGTAQEPATSCFLNGPWYWLNSDSVDWRMSLARGQSCLRGVRHNLVTLDEIKLILPPENGRVTVEGPGFVYRSDPNFIGQDSFTLTVSGKFNKIQGTSTIHILVSVK
jgi:hypothetical protein